MLYRVPGAVAAVCRGGGGGAGGARTGKNRDAQSCISGCSILRFRIYGRPGLHCDVQLHKWPSICADRLCSCTNTGFSICTNVDSPRKNSAEGLIEKHFGATLAARPPVILPTRAAPLLPPPAAAHAAYPIHRTRARSPATITITAAAPRPPLL